MKKFITLVLLVGVSNLFSQTNFKLSGLTYFDYFYNIQRNEGKVNEKDEQGFQFRRVWLTSDFNVSDKLSARLRIESDGGVFNDSAKKNFRFNVFLKDVYVNYKFAEQSEMYAGMIPTPIFEIEEQYWGYRSVEKILADLKGFSPISDLGISIRGSALEKKSFKYWLMVGNNSVHSAESDKYKRFYSQFSYLPVEGLQLVLDAQFASASNNKNLLMGKIGFYYQKKGSYSFGITAMNRTLQKFLQNDKNLNSVGASVFTNFVLDNLLNSFLRIDYFDPNSSADSKDDSEIIFIAGLDFKLDNQFSIIPNLAFSKFEKSGIKSDITSKVTFFWKF
ncbi:MAG: hypothetical protein N3A61_05065 [Ignavibacteria bacterium]|nr:hypothetical protein [Ignavibacteria bacterium]